VRTVDLAHSIVSPPTSSSRSTIVIHGLFGAASNWRSVSTRIAEISRSNVFLLDMRNHGASPHTNEMDYNTMMSDVHAFINKHSLGLTSVIGHSMGGKVAMLLALKHPEMLEKLVVVDIPPSATPESSSPFVKYIEAMQFLDLRTLRNRKQADAALQPAIKNDVVRQFLLTNLETNSDNSFKWRCNLQTLKTNINALMEFPPVTEKFTGKTLFVGGELSPYLQQPQFQQDIHSLFPNAEISIVKGAGHWVHFEKPTEFLDLISKFFN